MLVKLHSCTDTQHAAVHLLSLRIFRLAHTHTLTHTHINTNVYIDYIMVILFYYTIATNFLTKLINEPSHLYKIDRHFAST